MHVRLPHTFKYAVLIAGIAIISAAAGGAYWSIVDAKTASIQKTPSLKSQVWTFASSEPATLSKLSGIHPKQTATHTPASVKAADTSGAGHDNPALPTVIVNKKHPLQPLDYTPPIASLSCDGTVAYLNPQAAASFTAMCTAATDAGLPFRVTSSFRSYQNQVATYNYWVQQNGSAAAADTVSARPGYSEHQTGFAFDVASAGCALECFAGTPHYAWMQTHAAEYGFIQRYYAGSEAITGYSAEAWHYRYVGSAVALDMKARGIKTLEQYWNVTGGDY